MKHHNTLGLPTLNPEGPNKISHCEQAGIAVNLGAVFSLITGNDIHDIHIRKLFSGSEMAGIKLHAAIDVQIVNNHIYRTWRVGWSGWERFGNTG